MNRVSHCSDCERCKSIVNAVGYTEYYCCKNKNDSVYGETEGNLGVDHLPKTSPKWCSKRNRR